MRSLVRSGASTEIAERINADLKPRLYPGISTKKIYRIAFGLLKERSRNLAAKYHLKRAIMELGPSGFPFEKFISEILSHQGYSTVVGEVVRGQCVNHEIDVIAEKAEHHFMVECKFHNQPGTVCDVKVPLYIQARFKDVEASWIKLPGHVKKFHQGWVVTNTRFTTDAIQYGKCAGLKLIGWDYPDGESLRSRIDTLGLYPVTCLISLTRAEKQALLRNQIVLCKDICHDQKVLLKAGVSLPRIRIVQEEGIQLCEFLSSRNKQTR
ncbi:MAG: restriction endonuclease [Bacteroidota bacterium]